MARNHQLVLIIGPDFEECIFSPTYNLVSHYEINSHISEAKLCGFSIDNQSWHW